MSEQTLTSLAVLTVNWEHGHDMIDSFVPLIADCIRHNGGQPVALVELQEDVQKDAGIKIPAGTLEAIVGRCAKRGLVQKSHGVYQPNTKELDALDYSTTRQEAVRKHATLLDRLRDFARERYELDWSEQEAEQALLGYLQDGSVPVLQTASEGDPLPEARKTSRRTRHVVATFAGHLAESDSVGFECLETVVKGHILSGVLFYPDIGQVQLKFGDLTVYCDTPVLLPVLGYAEEGIHCYCLDLVELLTELGAKLRCFHHTREEVVGVLEAEAARLRSGNGEREVTDYTTSRNFRLHEIEEMIVKIDETLGKLGITVVDRPSFTDKPDEHQLEAVLKNRINYQRDRAREKDVMSLAAVARLRSMRRVDKFESAQAIFVTTNTTLTKASSSFFKDIEGVGAIPIA